MRNVWDAPNDIGITLDDLREQVMLHLERGLGEAQPAYTDAEGWAGRSHEAGPPVDVMVVPPEGERRFAFVTSLGCAMRPLPARLYADRGEKKHVEFVLAAPQRGEKNADMQMLNLAANTVRQFAKLAHMNPITVEPGETVAFSDDPEPLFDDSDLVAFAFISPMLPDSGFARLRLANRRSVGFVAPIPIYREELDLARTKGPDALARALERAGVTEMLHYRRPNSVKRIAAPRRTLISRLLGLIGIK